MTIKIWISAAALGLFGLSGCATITRGTKDAFVVETDPAGAQVSTSNGHSCAATPCTMKIARRSDFTVTISKEGYEPWSGQVTNQISGQGGLGMAGNVVFGGIIGAGVDLGTGAMHDLTPNPLVVRLETAGAAPALARTPAPVVPAPAPVPVPVAAAPVAPALVAAPVAQVQPAPALVALPAPVQAPIQIQPPVPAPIQIAPAPVFTQAPAPLPVPVAIAAPPPVVVQAPAPIYDAIPVTRAAPAAVPVAVQAPAARGYAASQYVQPPRGYASYPSQDIQTGDIRR